MLEVSMFAVEDVPMEVLSMRSGSGYAVSSDCASVPPEGGGSGPMRGGGVPVFASLEGVTGSRKPRPERRSRWRVLGWLGGCRGGRPPESSSPARTAWGRFLFPPGTARTALALSVLCGATSLAAIESARAADTILTTATLTVKTTFRTFLGCGGGASGTDCPTLLTNGTFTFGGNANSINRIFFYPDTNTLGSLLIKFENSITVDDLILDVAGTELKFTDAPIKAPDSNTWRWTGDTGLRWSVNDTVVLKLIHRTTPNAAPTVANEIPNQTAAEGSAFSYAFPVNTFNDTDSGDTLAYTATKGDGTALPGWLRFTTSSRTFAGTPQSTDAGTLAVKVTASDGTDTVSDTFNIVVSAAPVPVVSIAGGAAVVEGTSATFTLTAAPAPTGNITVNVTVADSGAFAGAGQTGARTVRIGTGGTVRLTVSTVDDRTDEPNGTVTATVGAGTGYSVHRTSGSATVTVNDNDGRSVTVSKSALTIAEGNRGRYTVVLNTQPTGDVTITPVSSNNTDVTVSPTPLTFTTGNWDTVQTVTVSAAQGSAPGSATITHTVSGADYGTVAAPAVAVSVTAPPSRPSSPSSSSTNAAPEFTSAAEVSAAENQREVLTVQAVDADEADGAVRYSLSGGADQARFALDPASGALTFRGWPDYENPSASGGDNEYVVIVQATSGADGRERSAEQTITVTVTDVEEVVLEPGTPVKESGVYQQGRSTITVADTASVLEPEVSVTLPDAIVNANGDALLQVTVTLADAPSTPLPERSAFGFDDKTLVDIEVSPVPVGGVELCLPVSATLRAKSGGQPLQVLHFSGGAWRALPSEDKEQEGQVCASGVSEFSPFMAGFAVTTAAAAATVVEAQATPAWLARFGRAVTDQVLDAVSGRLAAPKSAGVAVSLAGRAVPVWSRHSVAPEDGSSEDAAASAATPGDAVTDGLRASLAGPAERGVADALRSWLVNTGAGDDDAAGGIPGAQSLAVQSWSPTARDLRSGTSFALTGEPEADGALLSFWGQGALNRFDGREDGLALNGEAITLLVGADRSRQSHTVGAMLGYSQVVGGYGSSAPGKEAESGELEATLTGVYPYTGLVMRERLSAWAVAGYGVGDLTIKPEGGGSVATGLSLAMAAAGVRGEVLRAPQAGGLSLAVKGDVRVTRVSSDAAADALAGRLQATNAGVWRARAGIEGRRSFALDEKGGVVTPSFEVGARLDGGDAETGFGVDLGGGVALADPGRGMTAALKARGLVAHEDQGLREWGVSAAFAWDQRPQTQRGWSLSLVQSWGASSSGGIEALFSRDTLAGLAAHDESPVGRRLAVELGYGLAVFGGDFTGVPNVGVGLTGGGRDWRLGWRLTPAWPDASGFEVNLDFMRNEAASEATEHAVTLRGGLRF